MPSTLLDWLIQHYPTAKRETFRRMIGDRRVRVNGVVARGLKMEVQPTDQVEVADRPQAVKVIKPHQLPFKIVKEDDDILVIDKPAGLLTSTVPGERRPTLLAAVREYVLAGDSRAQVGLIHRLDRDASGLLVFSKADSAYQSLKTQLFKREFERVYLAVTEGVPNPREGTIDSYLIERADGTVYTTRVMGKGERAITHYEVLESTKKRGLVRVRLETGRKHQIRVHLAERRTPILGDTVYGEASEAPRLMLAAIKLGFVHPRDGKPVTFEIQVPKAFAACLKP
jgi:23S rRNA pseudouridine1911/1915/1917 synthase